MLYHLNETAGANLIQSALAKVYTEATTLTKDVCGTSGTKAFTEAVIAALWRALTARPKWIVG